jgi:hypothetical protein
MMTEAIKDELKKKEVIIVRNGSEFRLKKRDPPYHFVGGLIKYKNHKEGPKKSKNCEKRQK